MKDTMQAERLEAALRRLVGDDLPAEQIASAIAQARSALAPAEEHRKHPSGDYCIFCRSQWPCEGSEP
jgi:hypothetical protein